MPVRTIFRVESPSGTGPYASGYGWADLDHRMGDERHPSWQQDFPHAGEEWVTLRRERRAKSAFATLGHLAQWFSPTEQERLLHLGFRVTRYRIEQRYTLDSQGDSGQLLFSTAKVLGDGRPISWRTVSQITPHLTPA
jgi:hypothetical protein